MDCGSREAWIRSLTIHSMKAESAEIEIWVSVLGHEGIYEVSNLGRIRPQVEFDPYEKIIKKVQD